MVIERWSQRIVGYMLCGLKGEASPKAPVKRTRIALSWKTKENATVPLGGTILIDVDVWITTYCIAILTD